MRRISPFLDTPSLLLLLLHLIVVVCFWWGAPVHGFTPNIASYNCGLDRLRRQRLVLPRHPSRRRQISEMFSQGNDVDSSAASTAPPPTPCVRICRYNRDFNDGQVCIGCFREAFDIGSWASLNAQERVYALEDALERYPVDSTSLQFPGAIARERLQEHLDAYQAIAAADS